MVYEEVKGDCPPPPDYDNGGPEVKEMVKGDYPTPTMTQGRWWPFGE